MALPTAACPSVTSLAAARYDEVYHYNNLLFKNPRLLIGWVISILKLLGVRFFYQRSDLNPGRLVEKHVRLPVCCAVLSPVVWLNTSKYFSCWDDASLIG